MQRPVGGSRSLQYGFTPWTRARPLPPPVKSHDLKVPSPPRITLPLGEVQMFKPEPMGDISHSDRIHSKTAKSKGCTRQGERSWGTRSFQVPFPSMPPSKPPQCVHQPRVFQIPLLGERAGMETPVHRHDLFHLQPLVMESDPHSPPHPRGLGVENENRSPLTTWLAHPEAI